MDKKRIGAQVEIRVEGNCCPMAQYVLLEVYSARCSVHCGAFIDTVDV